MRKNTVKVLMAVATAAAMIGAGAPTTAYAMVVEDGTAVWVDDDGNSADPPSLYTCSDTSNGAPPIEDVFTPVGPGAWDDGGGGGDDLVEIPTLPYTGGPGSLDYTIIDGETGEVISPSAPKTDISAAAVTAPGQTYTSKPLTPAPTVTLGGATLVAGIDYAVSYRNNTNAGTATVTVTGRGGYTGTATGTFRIARARVAAPTATNRTYNGRAQTGVVAGTGCRLGGTTSATNAGAYTATATPDANHCWEDGGTYARSIEWIIAKAAQPMKVKAVKRTAKAAKVKKKAVTVAAPLKFTKKAQGKVTYARVAKGSAKCLTVNKKNGKVTVKRGTKKGTYKVKIKVTAKGNANYKAGSKTITCKVVVK